MKTNLPADRVLFFSDAVFAIAMTLLILEIDLPTIAELENFSVLEILRMRIPQFIGFVLSFLVTALFWRAHVLICKPLKEVSDRFVWLNILLLLFVVLMPYSTALYSSYGYSSNVAFSFYSLNLAAIGLFHLLIIYQVYKQEPVTSEDELKYKKWQVRRSIAVVFIFSISAPLAWWTPTLARYLFIGIFLVHFLLDRQYRKSGLKENIG